MGKKLTNRDYCIAAKEIKAHPAVIKAIAQVESSGDGFLPDGRIVIRFEGHKFRSFTGKKYDKSHPHLSYPYSVQRSKNHSYTAFNQAFKLNPTAAMLATSWGKFQPMGFTHEEAGFDDVHEFVDFLKISERNQLIAFIRLMRHRGLIDEMQRGRKEDFTVIARVYNGPDFKSNNYDTKMWNNSLAFKKEKFDCGENERVVEDVEPVTAIMSGSISEVGSNEELLSKDMSDVSNADLAAKIEDSATAIEVRHTETVETGSGAVSQTVETKNEQDVNIPATVEGSKLYQGIGFWSVIKRDLGAAMGGNLTFQGISELVNQLTGLPEWLAPTIAKLALVVLIGTVVYFFFRLVHYILFKWHDNQRIKLEVATNADTYKKDINWVGI